MITIKNENDIKFKKIIDTRLRKNNIEVKCKLAEKHKIRMKH